MPYSVPPSDLSAVDQVIPSGKGLVPVATVSTRPSIPLTQASVKALSRPAPPEVLTAEILSSSVNSAADLIPTGFGSAVPELTEIPHSPAIPNSIQAQTTDPNQERLIQPAPPPEPAPAEPILAPPWQQSPPQPETSPPQAAPPPTTPPIQKVEITGSTVFGPSDFRPIVQSIQGRAVTQQEIVQVADAITQLYLNRGYITSRAIPIAGTGAEGIVQIQVIEGSLERIDIEGTRRLNPAYIRRRIERGAGTPLNSSKLEDQLRLLRIDPLFTNVEASLRAGDKLGQSILTVRVTEAKPVSGSVGIDNYSPPSVGSERLGTTLNYSNLTGIGDQLSGSYYRTTTGGAETYSFTYQAPVNPLNGTLQFRTEQNRNEVTQSPFDELGIRGKSSLYEFNYRQPIVRTPREEFALSLGFSYQSGQTFLFDDVPTPFVIGVDAEGNSRTSVIKFAQDYIKRDPRGAWALRSQFNFGTNLFNATQNAGSIPDGQFFSWQGQVQRVQQLSPGQVLIAVADIQLTPDGLLPSQQFVIGGGQSVRGFRQNVRSGDNGFRFSLEDRIALLRDASGTPTLQLAPFADIGKVWNVSDNPNPLPKQTLIASVGLGVLWQPLPRLNLRLDYGIPLVRLRDRGSSLQDSGFHFSLNYQF